MVALYKAMGPFVFGIIVTLIVTGFTKNFVGRLRPHFLAVCAPDYTLFNCTDADGHLQYITQNVCTGDESLTMRARLYHLIRHYF